MFSVEEIIVLNMFVGSHFGKVTISFVDLLTSIYEQFNFIWLSSKRFAHKITFR